MIRRTLIAAILCITLAGCGTGAQPQASPTVMLERPPAAATAEPEALSHTGADLSALRGTLLIDGSSTVFPIVELAAWEFGRHAPQVTISIGVSGTGGGFAKFCDGLTVISNASRPIKQEEIAHCAANGIEFIELPLAFDGLSVLVHPANSWASCITTAELRQIWEPAAQGRISRWSDIRPEWPAEPLHLYGAGEDSGTFDYFTEAIVGEEGVSRVDYTASEDDYVLVAGIGDDPLALGYFGYSYYIENQHALKALAIDGGQGCVAPSDASIADGSYQPLSRPLFIYVRADALERPEVQAFLTFSLRQIQPIVAQAGAIPLSDAAYQLVEARLRERTRGSLFSTEQVRGRTVEAILTAGGAQ